jgi:outer membrane protein OmpA-like peptidoglycan-associated protein
MKKLIAFIIYIILFTPCLQAQNPGNIKVINLITNGNFENGNKGFSSDFIYSRENLKPGEYTVTDKASALNSDYKNPVGGDHTSGRGIYLIVDSDGIPGKKVWRTTVNIIPNSTYTFSAFFCNLYKNRGSNSGFIINGMQIGGEPMNNDCKIKFTVSGEQAGETDKDIFHLFRWIRASNSWYSGTHSGKVEISIENLNYKSSGNDLALDDIEFTFIETMPLGYKPPKRETIMLEENREIPSDKYQVAEIRKIIKFYQINKGDSLGPGIYSIYKRKKNHVHSDSLTPEKGTLIQFDNVVFEQGKFDLLPEALPELDRLVNWMKQRQGMRIRLEGHTDNQGNPEKNLKLSQDRVNKVKEYLLDKGIAESRIEAVGYGGFFPIKDNSNEETRKLNRRVEFEILEK